MATWQFKGMVYHLNKWSTSGCFYSINKIKCFHATLKMPPQISHYPSISSSLPPTLSILFPTPPAPIPLMKPVLFPLPRRSISLFPLCPHVFSPSLPSSLSTLLPFYSLFCEDARTQHLTWSFRLFSHEKISILSYPLYSMLFW